MKITKKQIIKAIATEPILEHGNFLSVHDKDRELTKKDMHTCTVCAVGSVLRAAIKPAKLESLIKKLDSHYTGRDSNTLNLIEDASALLGEVVQLATFNGTEDGEDFDLSVETIELVNDKLYLSALSCTFEYLRGHKGMNDFDTRFAIINMVEALFPQSFTVDLNDALSV